VDLPQASQHNEEAEIQNMGEPVVLGDAEASIIIIIIIIISLIIIS
jgi:hypothetical protein